VVAIVKGREPARIMIAIGNKKDNRWHLQFAQRWIVDLALLREVVRWKPRQHMLRPNHVQGRWWRALLWRGRDQSFNSGFQGFRHGITVSSSSSNSSSAAAV